MTFPIAKERAPISEVTNQAYYDLINLANQEGFDKILATHKKFRILVCGAATARLG